MQLPFLDINTPFPCPSSALDEPNGLLALGADLSPQRLMDAYSLGIFPWFDDGEPLLWWSPDPRAILIPSNVYISNSMKKQIKKQEFTITVNHDFSQVINQCAAPRQAQQETWITSEMNHAYLELHKLGHAHSIEVWQNQQLIGGLYGVGLGALFCGESMFHRAANASKIALIALCQHFSRFGGQLIDCQISNDHLSSMGATSLSRVEFIAQIKQLKVKPLIHIANKTDHHLEVKCWDKQSITISC